MKIRYLPDAHGELLENVAYYHERNPVAAKHFAEAIRQEERHLIVQPWSAAKTMGEPRSWRIPRFPYSLIYRIVGQEVLIIALAHHSRRPGYWKDRLRETH